MRYVALVGLCLLQLSLVLGELESPAHSHFDYRAHHEQTARAVGRTGDTRSGEKTSAQHQAPPPRAGSGQEPERWAQYVPESPRSIAGEISQARREAREQEAAKRAQETGAERATGKGKSRERSGKKSSTQSALQRGVQTVKSATRSTRRRAEAGVHHLLHGDDDEGEDDDDDDDDERANLGARSASHVWNGLQWFLAALYAASKWSGRYLLWTPLTTAAEVIRWSASTSWRTTRWTGERAFVGPALTAGAPLLYLAEGLLFIFVWIPARVLGMLIRELYPVYVYLGAALTVGTAMGIASALILYIGSYFFSDSSAMEGSLASRAETIPEDLQRRFRQKKKNSSSPAKKWARKGESIIERAIKESLQREERDRRHGHHKASQEYADSPIESDEEDDYFGDATTQSSFKGKARSSNDATPTGPVRRAPAHFGPPLPVGATSQGGWTSSRSDSTTSTPAASPVAARTNLPVGSASAFTSARSMNIPGQSPLTSPDIIRSGSHRQRRGLNASA